MKLPVNPRVGSLAVAAVLAASFTWVSAQQRGGTAVAIDRDDIGGGVTSSNGPEAGVWVIAETTDLPTKFARRSEEHTSELQSHSDLVCRLLLEKKNID